MLRSASRWILSRSPRAPIVDHEDQRFPPPANHDAFSDAGKRSLAVVATDNSSLIPSQDKLLIFRSLTGIDTVPAVTTSGHASRAAANLGIYPRVVQAEQKARRSFGVYNVMINTCLGTQIIVAAALTALGAANGSRAAVTAFGAINTVIAGFLTYLKGSGMPGRLKDIKDEFKAVREYIEQREREFCVADCPLDPAEEAQIVDDMYKMAKQDLDGKAKMGIGGGGRHGGDARHSGAALSVPSPLAQRTSKLSQSPTAPSVEK